MEVFSHMAHGPYAFYMDRRDLIVGLLGSINLGSGRSMPNGRLFDIAIENENSDDRRSKQIADFWSPSYETSGTALPLLSTSMIRYGKMAGMQHPPLRRRITSHGARRTSTVETVYLSPPSASTHPRHSQRTRTQRTGLLGSFQRIQRAARCVGLYS